MTLIAHCHALVAEREIHHVQHLRLWVVCVRPAACLGRPGPLLPQRIWKIAVQVDRCPTEAGEEDSLMGRAIL